MWDFNSKKFLNYTFRICGSRIMKQSFEKSNILPYEVGGIWRDCYIWHEQRPVQTPQQQQEVNGFKDGSMVTRYTLDLCSSTCRANHPRQGRWPPWKPGSPAPRGFGAFTQNSDLIRYRGSGSSPGSTQGLWSLKWYQICWNAIQMTWRCFLFSTDMFPFQVDIDIHEIMLQ